MDELNKEELEQQKEKQVVDEVKEQEEKELVEENPSSETVEETDDKKELSGDDTVSDSTETVEEEKDDGGEPGEEVLSDDTDKPTEVPEDVQTEVPTEEPEQPVTETHTPDIENLQRELEDLKFEKETQTAISDFQNLVSKQQEEYDNFNMALRDKVLEEFTKYGISVDDDIEELKTSDPAKFKILNNILTNAQKIGQDVLNEIQTTIQEAGDNIVFRIAGSKMKKYNLNPEELKESASTFVTIMNETGIKNLDDDIDSKVELAVARAKMLVGKNPEKITQKPEEVDDDVIQKTTAEEKKTTDSTPKGEKVVKTEGKKLEDFTKGVAPGTPPKGAEVTLSNVLDLYYSKPEKERLAFHAEHRDLILEALRKRRGI